jgi:hypothetical protein
MHYQYREVGFNGKMIRFIKTVDFDSDGLESAPISQLNEVAKQIEQEEANTIVVIMIGRSSTAVTSSQGDRGALLRNFWNNYQRLPDDYYDWEVAEL